MLHADTDLKLPSVQHERCLNEQAITLDEPGPIVRDFETLLDFVGEDGLRVSATQHLIYVKRLPELNARLSHPLDADYKRPTQQGYPYIHGLYLLLRATGLGYVVEEGRHHRLRLREPVLRSWDGLSATERYMTLVEAWIFRADEDGLLNGRYTPLTNLSRSWSFFDKIPGEGLQPGSEELRYYPGLYNLALMDLFGFVEIEEEGTEAGEGWDVRHVARTPFGDAMLRLLVWLQREKMKDAYEDDADWDWNGPGDNYEEEVSLTRHDLQHYLADYFPEWKNQLTFPEQSFCSGVHVFKADLDLRGSRSVWRRIALPGALPLDELAYGILSAFDFEDWEHLWKFTYQNHLGLERHVWHPYAEDTPSTDEVRVGDLPIEENARLTFIFDFGDWWQFDLTLERRNVADLDLDEPTVLDEKGKAPPQYPEWEGNDEDDEWW